MTHDDLQKSLTPQPSAIRKAGWFRRFGIPHVKVAQTVRPDDPIAQAVRARPITEEIVDDPQDAAMRAMGTLVSQQAAEIEGLQAQTMSASQAAQQAQQTIQQLQAQVQQLGQQAGQVQQVMESARQTQDQLNIRLNQAMGIALQAGEQATAAQMEAVAARRDKQVSDQQWQAYKQRLLQTLEMDPVQQSMQAQAAQMMQMQMAQAQMMQQGGGAEQGQQQGQQQDPQQAQQQAAQQQAAQQQAAQQQGMMVTAAYAAARERTRRDGVVALKLAVHRPFDKRAAFGGPVVALVERVHNALPESPTRATVKRLKKDLEGTVLGDAIHDTESGLKSLVSETPPAPAPALPVPDAKPVRVRAKKTPAKTASASSTPRKSLMESLRGIIRKHPIPAIGVGAGMVGAGYLTHRHFSKRNRERGLPDQGPPLPSARELVEAIALDRRLPGLV